VTELAVRDPQELPALARLGFEELARGVGGIASIHAAIATRAFAGSRSPARFLHDGISAGVYRALAAGAGIAGRGVAALVPREARVSSTKAGAAALAAINGLIGDQLEREGSPLAAPMSIMLDGRAVEPGEVPNPRSRLVVFLHGLMETELAWRIGDHEPYAPRLERDLGCTAIEIRYNTGRHISENGRSLAELLEEVVAAWPVEVEEIALVGHSMGGLVARSACHRGGTWTGRVRHVICLGSPHMGAPLAQAVHVAAAALDVFPESQPFGGFLRRRSGGIRDLRQGSLVDDDWRDCDPDALRAAACKEVPLLDGAMHCFIAATVTRGGNDPIGRLVGDCLVLQPSASGRSRTRRIPFREEHGMHLGGTHHLALLNHPRVYEKLREWLATRPG
jgi:pimeloyl-ACP methyl ester carboxylesterase